MKLKKIINWIFGIEEKISSYPNDFILIDFSPIAKQNGTTDDKNKIIYRYHFGEHDEKIVTKYRYSIERIKSLQETFNIPFYDKTKFKTRFPVFAKILPSEITYTTR